MELKKNHIVHHSSTLFTPCHIMQGEAWKMDACRSSLESSWPCYRTDDMPPWWGCLPLVVVTLRGAEALITAPLELHGLISQSPATVVIFNVATKETCQSAKWPVWLPGNIPLFVREEAKKTYSSAAQQTGFESRWFQIQQSSNMLVLNLSNAYSLKRFHWLSFLWLS